MGLFVFIRVHSWLKKTQLSALYRPGFPAVPLWKDISGMKKKSTPRLATGAISPHVVSNGDPLIKTRIRFLIVSLCAAVISTHSAHAGTITVTNTNDSGPGSLRNALAVANDGDTIDASGLSGRILLTSGELQITHSVTINGPGAGNLAVDGNAQSGVFYIDRGKTVAIDSLTVENGNSSSGGGIYNYDAALTVSNCTVSGNYGGGIDTQADDFGDAELTITNCTINRNSGSYGGGISSAASSGQAWSSSIVTVSNSTLSGNSVAGDGAAIYNRGDFFGGASLYVNSSTISGNSATGDGGGIYNSTGSHAIASLYVNNSTISGNSSTGNGGGIYNTNGYGYAELELGSTILNVGSSGQNIFNDGGTVTSLGYNVSSDDGGGFLTAPGDQINTDPVLGPLQNNGGPTFTHALMPGSPAINGGDPNFTPPPLYDQRGPRYPRVVNGRIDVGSFEVQSTYTPTPTPTPTVTATPRPTPTPRSRPTPKPR
jgi:hypothetical protein